MAPIRDLDCIRFRSNCGRLLDLQPKDGVIGGAARQERQLVHLDGLPLGLVRLGRYDADPAGPLSATQCQAER